jgi:hypothetical protein
MSKYHSNPSLPAAEWRDNAGVLRRTRNDLKQGCWWGGLRPSFPVYKLVITQPEAGLLVGWAAAGRGVSLVLLEGVLEGREGRGEYVGDVYMVAVCAALASVCAWWLYMRPWQVYMHGGCICGLGKCICAHLASMIWETRSMCRCMAAVWAVPPTCAAAWRGMGSVSRRA